MTNEILVWDQESIRLYMLALAAIATAESMQEGAYMDDPWENEPPGREGAWADTTEQARLLEETVFPGKEVDEPFLQSFRRLVEMGRELDSH